MKFDTYETSFLLTSHFVFLFIIFCFVNEKQSTPFIDEIYHIPQGLQYCNGNFTKWNPKITTLPGLYFISTGLLNLVSLFIGRSLCTGYYLKFVNVIFSSLNFYLYYSIAKFHNETDKIPKQKRNHIWTAFNMSIFPVPFLFSFFYYTDTLSIFFFLIMYRMHLSKNYWIAAILGFCSVIVRQTNVIWVGFLLMDLINHFTRGITLKNKNTVIIQKKSILESLNFLRVLPQVCKHQKLLLQLYQISVSCCGYIFVCLMFLLFLIVNRGIVIGDRTAHKPVIHLCQIFYFLLFTIIFASPHFFFKLKPFCKFIAKKWKISLLITFICAIIVYCNTMAHPYLLADNRHYSFYLWKNVYQRHQIIKYILIPVYLFGFYCLHCSLKKNWFFEYYVCVCMCLVPHQLLEFRYFIIPFIVFRLQIKCNLKSHLLLETVLYIITNYATLYIFAKKEFYWSDSRDTQRIIW